MGADEFMDTCQVTFIPDQLTVEVPSGTTLLDAARRAGISMKSSCGGQGTCGRCLVKVDGGQIAGANGNLPKGKREDGYVTACTMTVAAGPVQVTVPEESRLHPHQVLLDDSDENLVWESLTLDYAEGDKMMVQKIHLTLPAPNITENADDVSRLIRELKKNTNYKSISTTVTVLRKLPRLLREQNWQVTATLLAKDDVAKVVHVEPGFSEVPPYGVAVDIGTTTVVLELVDMSSGEVLSQKGSYNRQALYGDDIITRIVYAEEDENGLDTLQKAVLDTINDLLQEAYQETAIAAEDVLVMAVSGNTTMCHLFYGIDPMYIRREPYIPAASEYPYLSARTLLLNMNASGKVIAFPSVASYVGGDIVSGTLVTGMEKQAEVRLFIDIGTNGEMVLGNSDWLMCCACSAGPAFEGGGISCGMRAMDGAIERIHIDKDDQYTVTYATVNNVSPVGICGSGLINSLAAMQEAGVIDRQGRLQPVETWRLREVDGEKQFVLVPAAESGTGAEIIITDADLQNLMRAKAAVFAGIRCMLKMMDLPLEVIDKIIIAGGFGSFINLKDAVRIGLLPDLPAEKYEFIGNSSLKGAYRALLSKNTFLHAVEVGRGMTYLELSVGNDFMEEYVSAMFLPHTDLTLFPSLSD